MNVLFDTNVILDVLLDRKPFSEDSARLLAGAERREIAGFAAATTITTIHYLCSKAVGKSRARRELERLLSILDVAPVNRAVLESALASKIGDFEDAVLAEAGALVPVDAIATRNAKDFAGATTPVYSPVEILNLLDLELESSSEQTGQAAEGTGPGDPEA